MVNGVQIEELMHFDVGVTFLDQLDTNTVLVCLETGQLLILEGQSTLDRMDLATQILGATKVNPNQVVIHTSDGFQVVDLKKKRTSKLKVGLQEPCSCCGYLRVGERGLAIEENIVASIGRHLVVLN